jgi:hypothetical protein
LHLSLSLSLSLAYISSIQEDRTAWKNGVHQIVTNLKGNWRRDGARQVWIASPSESCFYKIDWDAKLSTAQLSSTFTEPSAPVAGQAVVVYQKCLEAITGMYRNRQEVEKEEKEAKKKIQETEEKQKARSASGSVLSASLTVLVLVLVLALVC